MPEKSCPSCATVFKARKNSKKFCSLACVHVNPQKSNPCLVCGGPTRHKKNRYCSKKCFGKRPQTRMPPHICPHCNISFQTSERKRKYCSVPCASAARHRIQSLCLVCSAPVKKKGRRFCSAACFGVDRRGTERYCKCGNPLSKGEISFCSRRCAADGRRGKSKIYPPELIAQIRQQRGEGLTAADIAAKLGMGINAIRGVFERFKIAAPVIPIVHRITDHNRRRDAIAVQRRVAATPKPKWAAPPPPSPIKLPSGPRSIHLELREVYQWGAYLRENHSYTGDCGDIHAVSRAMKHAEPGHPGFALKMRRTPWTFETDSQRRMGEAA